MSGSILEGLDEQLNQKTEDITPYYYENSIYNRSNPPPPYHYYPHNEAYAEDYFYMQHDFLFAIIVILIILTLICTVIMILLCVKCCSGTNLETDQVPPPFVYVIPFAQSQSSILQPQAPKPQCWQQPSQALESPPPGYTE